MGRIRVLGANEVDEVVDVLCESFFDYPVMTYVVGPANDYPERLRELVRFFVMARVHGDETLLGLGAEGDLDGVALVSRAAGGEPPPALRDLKERLWRRLGDEARHRYLAFGAATARFDPGVSHIHLNMIGVRKRVLGKRCGRALLEHVHALSLAHPESAGVTLTTENPANVPLYEHFGYEIVGHARVAPELETWGFFRAD